MTIQSLSSMYMPQYPSLWGGNVIMPNPGIATFPSLFCNLAVPRYDVFNNNIFGFTPPTNFSYIPNNPFAYIGQIGFMPQIGMNNFIFQNQKPLYTSPINQVGLFDFLGVTSKSQKHTIRQDTNKSNFSSNSTINRALHLASSQIGVKEDGNSNNSDAVNKYRNGIKDGTPWCASFISWCFGKGQNSSNNKTFGYTSSSQTIRQEAEQAGVYSKASSGYLPKIGDLMILKYENGSGHVGIIEKVYSDGSFDVIEGNSSNQVKRNRRSLNTANLHGFVRMNEWLQA